MRGEGGFKMFGRRPGVSMSHISGIVGIFIIYSLRCIFSHFMINMNPVCMLVAPVIFFELL